MKMIHVKNRDGNSANFSMDANGHVEGHFKKLHSLEAHRNVAVESDSNPYPPAVVIPPALTPHQTQTTVAPAVPIVVPVESAVPAASVVLFVISSTRSPTFHVEVYSASIHGSEACNSKKGVAPVGFCGGFRHVLGIIDSEDNLSHPLGFSNFIDNGGYSKKSFNNMTFFK